MSDTIRHLTLSHVVLPLANPVSDAKVLTGRQKPLTETVLLFVEVDDRAGPRRAWASATPSAPAARRSTRTSRRSPRSPSARTPPTSPKIYESLLWAGASVGRSGVATQAIAALDVALWDLKARRADLPLAKLLGAAPRLVRGLQHLRRLPPGLGRGDQGEGDRLARGRHRRHQDQGRPARLAPSDLRAGRRAARAPRRRARSWSTPTSSGTAPAPAGCAASSSSSTWSGSRSRSTRGTPSATPTCRATFDTPIATGEMLTSVPEHMALIDAGYRGIVQPDAPADRRHHAVPPVRHAAAHHAAWRWRRTTRWRSTCTSPRRTRPSRGSSTSSGSTRSSTSASRSATAGCGCRDRPGLGFTLSDRMRALHRGDALTVRRVIPP